MHRGVVGEAPAPPGPVAVAPDGGAPVARWGLALASVGVSLVVRIVHRGPYYPGFDIVGAANGLFLLSTRSAWAALREVLYQSRHYSAPFPYFGVLSALLPGALTALWPWEYWAHVVTFGLFTVILGLILLATAVPFRDAWILLLGWGASGALLSFSVAGMPWVTGFLPHALALWIVLDPRLRHRWLVTVLLCLLATELPWHVYELGKTACLVFVLGALIVPDVPRGIRALWLATGALGLLQVFAYPSVHVEAFTGLRPLGPAETWARIATVGKMLATAWLDVPLLVVAATVACLSLTREQRLLGLLFGVQLGLMFALAMRGADPYEVRPRRFLMVDLYALTLVASAWGRGGRTKLPWVRPLLVALLLAGNVWQLVEAVRFVRTPFERTATRDFGFTLPFTESQVDYMVRYSDVDWSRELAARVEAGEKLLLVYNLGAYDENYSNPEALLERLYLHLGHQRFVDSVFAFGTNACRHTCLPIRPMREFARFLDGIRAGRPVDRAAIVGYWVAPHEFEEPVFAAERGQMMRAIRARFMLELESAPDAKFVRFRLGPDA